MYKKRLQTCYKNSVTFYGMEIEKGYIIDAHSMGNSTRFINHSCEPNCIIEKWVVNAYPCLAIFANRDIDAGDDLTYDYKFVSYNGDSREECLCCSSKCSGVLGRVS